MRAIIIKFDMSTTETESSEQVEARQKELIKDLGSHLITRWIDFSVSKIYLDHHSEIVCVTAKSSFGDSISDIKNRVMAPESYLRKFKPGISAEEYTVCSVDNCYALVASNWYAVPGAGLLHDRHGESWHQVQECCKDHVTASAREIMRTLEKIDETPEEKFYWTKILVWRMRQRWYAQRIEQDQDGDYETGYHPYLHATPWQGPYADKYAAIEAAQSYKD